MAKYRLKSYETAALVWIIPRRGNCSLLLLRLLRLLLRLLGLAAWRMAAARFMNSLIRSSDRQARPPLPATPSQVRQPSKVVSGPTALVHAGRAAPHRAMAKLASLLSVSRARRRLGRRWQRRPGSETGRRRWPAAARAEMTRSRARILTGLRESSALTLRDTGGPLTKNSTQARKSQRRLRLSHSDGVRCCSL